MDPPRPPPHPNRFTLISVAVELSLVPLALWIERIWPLAEMLGFRRELEALALGALGALPPLCLLLWMVSPKRRDLGFLKRIRQILSDVAGPTIAALRWWHIVPISISAGIGEEVLFRGVLQPRLGILLASALFGLLHPFTAAYVLIAGLLGAYFGWLQSLQGNVLAPILAHGIYDAVALVVMRKEMRSLSSLEPPAEEPSDQAPPGD